MLYCAPSKKYNDFVIERDPDKCIDCRVCERQCSYEAHIYDEATGKVYADDVKCVGCHRCETLCPTGALTIRQNPSEFRDNAVWKPWFIKNIYKQADTGGVLLTGMGNAYPYPVYWDKMLLDASQVTNPSIDPLREPMELRTYLGARPDAIKIKKENGTSEAREQLHPPDRDRLPDSIFGHVLRLNQPQCAQGARQGRRGDGDALQHR